MPACRRSRIDFRDTCRRPKSHRRRKDRSSSKVIAASTPRPYAPIFTPTPDGHFDDAARDAALKSLIATGLFEKVSIERAGERLVVHLSEAPVLDRVAFEGNKKVKDTDLAAAVEVQAARLAAARHRAGRRRPHHRGIPACRPLRGPRRSANHRPRQWPGRPRLRHHGGRKDAGAADRLHRQQGLRQTAAQRRDQDLRHQYAEFSDRR